MKTLLKYFILLCVCSSYGQDSIATFSQTLQSNIEKYIEKSNQAYSKNDFKEGKRLFDSLVNYKLIGTRFDDFTVKTLSSKKINLNKIDKPLLIVTYASWCVINKGDIPALNQLAKNHKSDLKIMVILWGNKKDSKKISNLLHNNIQVAYIDFGENENYKFISQLKNTLGFPTSYFLNPNKTVINISRISNPYFPNLSAEKATSNSYRQFSTMINEGLMKYTKEKNVVVK